MRLTVGKYCLLCGITGCACPVSCTQARHTSAEHCSVGLVPSPCSSVSCLLPTHGNVYIFPLSPTSGPACLLLWAHTKALWLAGDFLKEKLLISQVTSIPEEWQLPGCLAHLHLADCNHFVMQHGLIKDSDLVWVRGQKGGVCVITLDLESRYAHIVEWSVHAWISLQELTKVFISLVLCEFEGSHHSWCRSLWSD